MIEPQWPSESPCKLAFIGEAPGSEEVLKGQPFVGPAGRVFNTALRTTNIDRAACLVTNVFNEKAPDNDVTDWLRDPARMADARARLQEELDAAKPNCLVLLGATALYAFTGHQKIASFRGAVLPATLVTPNAKCVPTFHPAAVMRQWKLLGLLCVDLIKAAKEAARGPSLQLPKRTLWIAPTLGEVTDFLQKCHSSDLLSVDIETGWGMITCIGFAPDAENAMCVPFVDLRRPNKSYWPDAATEVKVWKLVRDLLADRKVPKLGQNFVYDLAWLYRYGIPVYNYRHDTRLMHHALYPELPKDLGSMAASYTNLPSWKHWGYRGAKEASKRDA